MEDESKSVPLDDKAEDTSDRGNIFTRTVRKLNWFRPRLDKGNTRKFSVPEIISLIASLCELAYRGPATTNTRGRIDPLNSRVPPIYSETDN